MDKVGLETKFQKVIEKYQRTKLNNQIQYNFVNLGFEILYNYAYFCKSDLCFVYVI